LTQVAALFSGGVDSTVVAVRLLQRFDRVHLLTWDTGAGIIGPGRSRYPAGALAERYPGRVLHVVDSCAREFDRIIRSNLIRTYLRYRSRFVWCMGCKLAMHVATLRYCRREGIADAADGSSEETAYYVEQMPVSVQWLREFYERHGLTFHTPAHEFPTRDAKIRLLDEAGLPRGRTVLGRNPGTQPFCVPGNFIYLLSTAFDIHPRFDPVKVEDFLRSSESLLDALAEP